MVSLPREALPAERSPGRGASGRPSGRQHGFRAFVASLDPRSRRTLGRLAAELLVLAVVVAVVYGGPAMRGGSRPPGAIPMPSGATPPPTLRPPSLGIPAREVIIVFAIDRFGGFVFTDGGPTDGEAYLVGVSDDAATTIDLAGSPTDLRRVTMTLQVSVDGVMDGAQRRHVTTLLALFAPDALETLLSEMRDALDSRRDGDMVVRGGRIDARVVISSVRDNVVVTLAPSVGQG